MKKISIRDLDFLDTPRKKGTCKQCCKVCLGRETLAYIETKSLPLRDKPEESYDAEITAFRKLGVHENIVTFFGEIDFGDNKGPNAFLTEFCPTSLKDFVEADPSNAERMRVSLEIISGLAYIHSKNLIHLDIKPENVMLDSSNTAKIIDFDLAVSSTNPRDWKGTGTEQYMAPEVLENFTAEWRKSSMATTTKADVYSLGGVLLYVFTGHEPYDEDDESDMSDLVETGPPDDLKNVPLNVRGIVSSCFEVHPDKRPSARDVLTVFSKLMTIDK